MQFEKREMKMRLAGKASRAAVFCLCAGLVLGDPMKGFAWEQAEHVRRATGSNALDRPVLMTESKDLWENWVGDLGFLDGTRGDGSREKPFQISTKAQLMGLSRLAAMEMEIKEGEGTYPGDYSGACFELTRDIDLGGMEWIPIGFYRSSAQIHSDHIPAFQGRFDGNGKTISNFRLYRPDWSHMGLFGSIRDSEITDLTVSPGHVITAGETAGILAGSVQDSVIRNVAVAGALKTAGNTGGVAGEIEDTVVENCTADHVAMDLGKGKETFAGGIAGKAAGSVISDCTVNTGDSLNARIQGGGYVGGITGFQNDTDIFNVHVMGTIGGSGSQAIGGVTGKYASGKMKVARFEGKIASSGLGSSAREGTFIGTHDTGFHFRYGTEAGADLAYLFADTEGKIMAGVCGSGIPDDNRFGYDAHIGFWHGKDNGFTLVQGQSTRPEEERYFYEELEEGELHVIDTEDSVKEMEFSPDHFAPGKTGRPARGFLVSVLQIDTAANVQNYYDVASLTAQGGSAYSKELDKSHRGAVAAGDTVTVITAPRNTGEEKYQMDGVPFYTGAGGGKTPMAYQTGGSYTFVMPEHDTEISAVYKKVAADIRVTPEELAFHVTEERTGNRKSPSIVTEVRNDAGKLIARYINGSLEEGTKVQEVKVEAVVDKNNDVADSRVQWSVDDGELLLLKQNPDEDSEGYTEMSASLELDLKAGFFRDIIEKAEKEQADKGFKYPIPDTIYGNGTLGGLAVLTAKTRPAASFEGKPLTANCRIPVTFQIKDRTRVAAEGASLDREELFFTVTRTLTGDRKAPVDTVTVTGPQTLSAVFSPDHFDKRDVSWSVDDKNVIRVDAGGYGQGNTEEDYKNARVEAVKDTRWIRDIMTADDAVHEADPYARRSGEGKRTAFVTVAADDSLGNRQTASCRAEVSFVTVDQTKVLAEEIQTDREKLEFDMVLTKTGRRSDPVLIWTGTGSQKVTAVLYPQMPEGEAEEDWPELEWKADRELLSVSGDGLVTPAVNAGWIQEAMKRYPYSAQKTTTAVVGSGDKKKEVTVVLNFKMEDQTYRPSGSGSSGGHSSGSASSGITTRGKKTADVQAPKGSITGVWVQDGSGRWIFTSGGRTYAGEWAYIHNPYASEGQESTSWFRFSSDGAMVTGWFQDPADGNWYYLHDISDGSLGRMYTGWHRIGGIWYAFGPSGRMLTGWNWINGRCYYLEPESGRMLSDAVTPDGYTVDSSGAWTVNGKVQVLGRDLEEGR